MMCCVMLCWEGRSMLKDSEVKKLKKKVLTGKLAPFYPGIDGDEVGVSSSSDSEECPICFLSYPALNRSKCCGKGICSECFVQLKVSNKRPSSSSSKRLEQAQCPFCKEDKYEVAYHGKKSWEEKSAELEEERKVEEAKQRWLESERERDMEIARKRSLESSSVAPSPQPSPLRTEGQATPSQRQGDTVAENSFEIGSPRGGAPSSGEGSPASSTGSRRDDVQERQPQQLQRRENSYSSQSQLYADYIPAQFQELNGVLGNLPDLDIDELMLNQAILESLVQEAGERTVVTNVDDAAAAGARAQGEEDQIGEEREALEERDDGGEASVTDASDELDSGVGLREEDSIVPPEDVGETMDESSSSESYEASGSGEIEALGDVELVAEIDLEESMEAQNRIMVNQAILQSLRDQEDSESKPSAEQEASENPGDCEGPSGAANPASSDEQVMMNLLSAMDLHSSQSI
mmetsp:Transcript_5112/g.15374  ORF Transcript_5112/g.15374 Transcript_5112/m.15374 type:complete len:463 (-) Transcript_5112:1653-3041(-)